MNATGLLATFNEACVLDAADVHVARSVCRLAEETSEVAQLAVALTVRALRHGSVVVDLDEVSRLQSDDETVDAGLLPWPGVDALDEALQDSPLLGGPLRREGNLLWLESCWTQEVFVADEVIRRATAPVSVDREALGKALARLWPGDEPDDQRLAAALCGLSRFSILGGGPGTGKTTTVARLLIALRESSGPVRVALAAPTGRAAARLYESLTRADSALSEDESAYLRTLSAQTLHRLIGIWGSREPRHNATNRLPFDFVVVDEASMVSLSMFATLLAGLREDARLILVGDPNQLASVEAGAALSDLVGEWVGVSADRAAELSGVVPHDVVAADAGSRIQDNIALLSRNRRFEHDGPIDLLAKAVRDGDVAGATERLSGIDFVDVAESAHVPDVEVRRRVMPQLTAIVAAAELGDAVGAQAALAQHRLLCAHRTGPRGVTNWDRRIFGWLLEEGVLPRRDGRFAGQPLLVTSNDYDNELWNGDVGVVVADGEDLVAAFGEKRVPLGRLGDVRQMYAMTVHKAQGSQFPSVTVVLPPAKSPLGTRETLYTALTRAEKQITLIGSHEAVAAAVTRRASRASGLGARLM